MARAIEVHGFEEFGLRSLKELAALGSRRVTVEVSWYTPPVSTMLRLTPRQRRHRISTWYWTALRTLIKSAPGITRVPGSQGGLLSLRADLLPLLRKVDGLGHLWITSIDGLRKRKEKVERREMRTYAVKIRMVEEIAGKLRGVQHLDERILTLRALDPKAARKKVQRHIFRVGYQSPYVDTSGNPIRWRVEEIGIARAVVVDPLRDGVTTVWTEGSKRQIKPGSGWKP